MPRNTPAPPTHTHVATHPHARVCRYALSFYFAVSVTTGVGNSSSPETELEFVMTNLFIM